MTWKTTAEEYRPQTFLIDLTAAPDLLEACEGWVALYQSHNTGDCTPPGCVVCRTRAAIAKAKGEK